MKFHTFDLLICLRCHAMASFIEDTIDSVLTYTNPDTVGLMCAVDGRPQIAKRLNRVLPGAVMCSGTQWGWGAGLYGLLAESIVWSQERWNYSHFLSIDYDTLFIGPGADETLLSLITEPEIGLIGEYNPRNVHWEDVYKRDKTAIKTKLGAVPRTYRPGEGVQGGCMLLTRVLLDELSRRGMLKSPFVMAKNVTQMADDHLIALYCRMCGLDIAQVTKEFHVRWQLDRKPLGLESEGVKVFHPTKIKPSCKDRGVELQVRNYYRALRSREPLV